VAREHTSTSGRDPTDRRPAVRHTHHLELTVADTPLVLDRIVSLCRARRCTIVALRFEAADRHRPGRLLATVEADAKRLRIVTGRLLALPGVLAVAHVGGERVHVEVHTAGVTERAERSRPRAYRRA
jgi:acetolactate synthase small subunit